MWFFFFLLSSFSLLLFKHRSQVFTHYQTPARSFLESNLRAEHSTRTWYITSSPNFPIVPSKSRVPAQKVPFSNQSSLFDFAKKVRMNHIKPTSTYTPSIDFTRSLISFLPTQFPHRPPPLPPPRITKMCENVFVYYSCGCPAFNIFNECAAARNNGGSRCTGPNLRERSVTITLNCTGSATENTTHWWRHFTLCTYIYIYTYSAWWSSSSSSGGRKT